MVNQQPDYEMKNVKTEALFVFHFTLIDRLRLFVYRKVCYIDCNAKSERFTDIYLSK